MNFQSSAIATLPSDQARTLLRRLRDLNLSAGPIAVTRHLCWSVAGCLSLDGPAENGVRYRLRDAQGTECILELAWRDQRLHMTLEGARGRAPRALEAAVSCDKKGRACIPSIGARVRPDSSEARDFERLLRRVVRALGR